MVHARMIFRHFYLVVGALLVSASILSNVGCAKENRNQGPTENVAVTPMDSCAAGYTYQGNQWSRTPYAQVDAVPYGHGMRDFRHNRHFATQGFCGCPGGTQPMCDGTVGVICLPAQVLTTHNDIAWYQHGQQGFAFSGFGGYTAYGNVYQPGPHYSQPAPYYPRGRHRNRQPMVIQSAPQVCATQIGQTCTVGVNTCGPNSVCRPMGPGQPVGICTR